MKKVNDSKDYMAYKREQGIISIKLGKTMDLRPFNLL